MEDSENFELMLPVGDKDMFFAAIANGANAVYFGVPHWNARGRTQDFSFEDIRRMIRYARVRHVKTFLAMNILVFEDEMDDLPNFIDCLAELEPDAVIVQDVGLMRLFQAVAPGIEVHASTQMTIASKEGVEMARRLGCTRAVLARELSLHDIRTIAENSPLELEVFVHGALCVSFSGQCLTSENIGGRSANRGQCAQSCRLPYKMLVDGKPFDLHGKNYLFSPRDLSALDDIDELKSIGVKSFKVEGRLKSPEYVAAVTRAFRKKIDGEIVSNEDREPLEVLFSRGLGPGWLHGVDQQNLVNGNFSNHHGMHLGKVLHIDRKGITVEGIHHLEAGDGILFENPGEENSTGSRLFSYKISGENTVLEFANTFPLQSVSLGMDAFRNDSPAMEKRLRKTFSDRTNEKRTPIQLKLSGEFGEPLTLEIQDEDGNNVIAKAEKPLEKARTPQENFERIRNELAALSGTAYAADQISLEIPAGAFILDKEIRQLKKQAILFLNDTRLLRASITPEKLFGIGSEISAAAGTDLLLLSRSAYHSETPAEKTQITVLIRRPWQLEKLKGASIDRVILDLDWGVDYKKPMEIARSLGFQVGIATIRVLREGETKNLDKIVDLKPDFILVRNPGALIYLQKSGIPLEGDYSLNISNSLSAEWFLNEGLSTLHPSLDLNAAGTECLLKNFGGSHFEISVFEHLPAFDMEHCLHAANLTKANQFPYCGQICSKHHIDIVDHKGARHSLVPDAECRNTLYLERPQSALNLVPAFKQLGVNKFRLEMLEESASETADKVRLYAEALRGRLSLKTAAKLIGAEEKYGVAQGQLYHTEVWQNRKK